MNAEALAAAATPMDAFRIVDAMIKDVLFDGLRALIAGSGFRERDARLFALVKQIVSEAKGYSDEQANSFVAGFAENIARNVDALAPRELLVSKIAVDAAAIRAIRKGLKGRHDIEFREICFAKVALPKRPRDGQLHGNDVLKENPCAPRASTHELRTKRQFRVS